MMLGVDAARRCGRAAELGRWKCRSVPAMAGEVGDVSEFLKQNRETATWLDGLRGSCESDKLWRHRREFILRNMEEFCGPGRPPPLLQANHRGLDQLLAYSMVWANHVFTGCRYPPVVMDKALKMAENVKITDAPVHTTRDELVSKVKKRGTTSNNGQQNMHIKA